MAKNTFEIDWKRGKSPSAFVGKLALFDRALDNRLEAAMDDAVLMVERESKGRAPVDSGNLRASIASEVRTDVKEAVKGVVGSNVSYAPFPGIRNFQDGGLSISPTFDRCEKSGDRRPVQAGGV